MNKVVFFWNDRMDGGVHFGLVANDVLLFDELKDGSGESDPALNWFVDIKCESKSLPKGAAEIRNWILNLAPQINQALDALASKLEVGTDGDISPFSIKTKVSAHPASVHIEVKGSALRTIRETQIAGHIMKVKKSWERELRRLSEVNPILA